MPRGFNQAQARAMKEYAALPKSRRPKNVRDFCYEIGVNTRQFYDFTQNPKLKGEIAALALASGLDEALPEPDPVEEPIDENFNLQDAIERDKQQIYEGMKRAAAGGNAQAAKILLQASGDLVEESKTKVTHEFDIRGAVKAVRDARREIDGMGQMHGRPPLLPDPAHDAPEPGADGDT